MADFFDFHTHLDFYKDEELGNVVRQIFREKLRIFSASVNITSYERNLMIEKMLYDEILSSGVSENEVLEMKKNLLKVTFGVHPSYCKELPGKESDAVNLLKPHYEKTEIISEAGLDFFWEKEVSPDLQKMHLQIALDSAHSQGKIIVLHTKGAEKEIWDILQDFPKARPVIHWYDGPVDIYKKFLDKGYAQTFGCELKYSDRIREFLKMTPLELVLPETDNPTGEPWLGGNDSSPLLIKRIYKDIAFVKEKSEGEMAKIMNENLKVLLGEKSE